jgi:hypothetical protein
MKTQRVQFCAGFLSSEAIRCVCNIYSDCHKEIKG